MSSGSDRLCEVNQIAVWVPNDEVFSPPRLLPQCLMYRGTGTLILQVQCLHVPDRNRRRQQITVCLSVEDGRVNVPQIETSDISLNQGIEHRLSILEADCKAELRNEESTRDLNIGHKQLRMCPK